MIDFVDGKLDYSGNMAPTDAARLFFDELGKLLEPKVPSSLTAPSA